jgi:hypothetical protein
MGACLATQNEPDRPKEMVKAPSSSENVRNTFENNCYLEFYIYEKVREGESIE